MNAFPPIFNAKDIPIGSGVPTVPSVSTVLLDWFKTITFVRIIKEEVDYQVVEKLIPVTAKGVWQPLNSRELAVKPEGQRSWRWQKLLCTPAIALHPDDIVVADKIRYRVMGKLDWSENGYFEYHLTQDFNAEAAT